MIYLFHVDKHFQFYYICMYSHLLNTFLIKQVFILILCLLMIPCQKLNVANTSTCEFLVAWKFATYFYW